MPFKRITVLILFCLAFTQIANASLFAAKDTSLAAKKDSIAILNAKKLPSIVKYAKSSDLNYNVDLTYTRIDTSLDGLQVLNPIFTNGKPYKFLGNLASAAQPLFFNPYKKNEVQSGINQYRLYEILPEDINYFKTNKRFTELYYTIGSKGEQILNVTHTQNIKSNWNAGIVFRRMATNGFLNRQFTYVSNLGFFTSYVSRNERYHLYANAILNTLEVEENGGVTDNATFKNFSGILLNFPTNLTGAQARHKSSSISVTQSWDFGRFYKTNPADSTETPRFLPVLRVVHNFTYRKKSAVFADVLNDGKFYPNITPIDTASTKDSLYFSTINNRLGVATFSKFINFTAGITNQVFKYNQTINGYGFTSYSTNNIVDAGAYSGNTKGVVWQATGSYNIMGRNQGDYLTQARLGFRQNDSAGYFGFKAISQLQSPDIILDDFYGNYFKWVNHFNQSNASTAAVEYRLAQRYFGIELGYTTVQNYIGVNLAAVPEQYSQRFNIMYGSIGKDFKWRKWDFSNMLTYQHVDGIQVVRIPNVLSYQSLSYQDRLFKGAMLVQVGADLRYVSHYFGDRYMPETGLFYRQDDFKVHALPLVDVFINFRIKTARMFLKMENVTASTSGYGYMVPDYPLAARVVKFGISWRFFD